MRVRRAPGFEMSARRDLDLERRTKEVLDKGTALEHAPRDRVVEQGC